MKGITSFRILGASALIACSLAATLAAGPLDGPGRDEPAVRQDEKQEDKKGSPKKDGKADRIDAKGSAVAKVNVTVKADGAALADALILVRQPGGFERSSSTNSAGIAHFSQVPRAKTTIQVTAAGFKPHTSEQDLPGAEVNLAIVLEKQ